MVGSCQEEVKQKKAKKKTTKRRMRSEVTKGIVAGMLEEADTVGRGVTRIAVAVTQSTNVMDSEQKDKWKDFEQWRRRRQTRDCSQIGVSVEEGDVTDWYEGDELRKQ